MKDLINKFAAWFDKQDQGLKAILAIAIILLLALIGHGIALLF